MNLTHQPPHKDEPNPLIEIPDPFKELRANQEELYKNNPLAFEEERLCYEIFLKTEFGQQLLERWEKSALLTPPCSPAHPQASQISLHQEAIRGFIAKIKLQAINHRQRIESN